MPALQTTLALSRRIRLMLRFFTCRDVHNELGKLVGVTGSFGFIRHTPYMAPSREPFKPRLARMDFLVSKCPTTQIADERAALAESLEGVPV